jgi:hypothetical protein
MPLLRAQGLDHRPHLYQHGVEFGARRVLIIVINDAIGLRRNAPTGVRSRARRKARWEILVNAKG